jgi:ADP-ribose pyrophosphatase YjhB (NUDIX family)
MRFISETDPSNILKRCPVCGGSSFIFDGIKKFSCDACGFIYYINPAAAVCGIIELPDKRIILARRKFEPRAGTFDLPGGFVDMMESAEDAVIREIKEELGIDVYDPVFIGSSPNEYVYGGISYYTCDMAFLFRLKKVPEITPNDDISDACFIRPDDIDFNTVGFPSIVNLLKIYISKFCGTSL